MIYRTLCQIIATKYTIYTKTGHFRLFEAENGSDQTVKNHFFAVSPQNHAIFVVFEKISNDFFLLAIKKVFAKKQSATCFVAFFCYNIRDGSAAREEESL